MMHLSVICICIFVIANIKPFYVCCLAFSVSALEKDLFILCVQINCMISFYVIAVQELFIPIQVLFRHMVYKMYSVG